MKNIKRLIDVIKTMSIPIIIRIFICTIMLFVFNTLYSHIYNNSHCKDVDDLLFVKISQTILQFSPITFIVLFGLLGIFITYKNRITNTAMLLRILLIFFTVMIEARFIIMKEFDFLFIISIIEILLTKVILYLYDLMPNICNDARNENNASDETFSPIIDNKNLFDSRKNQQETLINLIKDDQIIKDGISVCIDGKWGSGKTSFVNATLDQLRKQKIPFEEINIKALELENLSDLVRYFFSRMKNILNKENIYAGIKSEYSTLVHSFINSTTSKSFSELIMSKFEEDDDYRKLLNRIDDILRILPDKFKIIIVIDDIERCSNEKIKGIMHFIKEIATMSKCISLFLINTDKICMNDSSSGNKTYDEEYIDKFFDIRIALKNVELIENANRFKDQEFSDLIIDIVNFYEQILIKCDDNIREYSNLGNKNMKQLETEKNKKEETKKKFDAMNRVWANPRRMNKIYYYYRNYSEKAQKVASDLVENNILNKEQVTCFFNNINYKKQNIIISILKDSFYNYYSNILEKGIYFAFKKNIDDCWLKDIIISEWFPLKTNFFTLYKTNYSDAIINNDDELLKKLVHPFSSLYDEYISYIQINEIPSHDNRPVPYEECFDLIHRNEKFDRSIAKKMFEIYSRKISLDKALEPFLNNSTIHYNEIALKEFADIFCTPEITINSIEICKKHFNTMSERILWKLLNDFTIYCCYIDENISQKISELIYDKKSINENLEIYFNQINILLNVDPNKQAFVKDLTELLKIIDKKYSEMKLPIDKKDFINLRANSESAIKDIDALLKIEDYLNDIERNDMYHSKTLLQETRDIKLLIYEQISKKEKYLRYPEFHKFLHKIELSELSKEEIDELDQMIEILSDIDTITALALRKVWLNKQNKENKENKENKVPNTLTDAF